jgi:hypothetical protein
MSRSGALPQASYDEAKKLGWAVISIKNDWTVIFPLEKR